MPSDERLLERDTQTNLCNDEIRVKQNVFYVI